MTYNAKFLVGPVAIAIVVIIGVVGFRHSPEEPLNRTSNSITRKASAESPRMLEAPKERDSQIPNDPIPRSPSPPITHRTEEPGTPDMELRKAIKLEGRDPIDRIEEHDVPKYRETLLQCLTTVNEDINVRLAASVKLQEFYRKVPDNEWLLTSITQTYRIEPSGPIRGILLNMLGGVCRTESGMLGSCNDCFKQAMYFDSYPPNRKEAVKQYCLKEDSAVALGTLTDLVQREQDRDVRRLIGDKISETKRALERRNE